jgi:hypothetical protein
MAVEQKITNANTVANKHPDYTKNAKAWAKVRDCLDGEDVIKSKKETYLPRPAGMSGEYADAYDSYIERAHFPLIVPYALSGALGVVITKMPEFNVPKELEYILTNATKDGRNIQQLFLDTLIEVFQTGRVPLLVDIIEENQFRFVPYTAEEFINWKTASTETKESEKNLILGVMQENLPESEDIFSHETTQVYRALILNEKGEYSTRMFGDKSEEYPEFSKTPVFMGKPYEKIPLFLAGSINNSFDIQPIPLVSVANISVQIYRKEADLANSEFLSCNPTLVLVGASNDDDLPNVVGSSVMMVIPNEAARVFYTTTDTAALKHVSDHIITLYEEAIRHGVAILDSRKGVEAAEALRIRQATQSASIYSTYLSAVNAIKQGLEAMCEWGGYNKDDVVIDAPSSLTFGIPDSSILKEIITGFGTSGVIPLTVVHRYLITSGLMDQKIGYEDYIKLLIEQKVIKDELIQEQNDNGNTNPDGNSNPDDMQGEKDTIVNDKKTKISEETKKETEGSTGNVSQ